MQEEPWCCRSSTAAGAWPSGVAALGHPVGARRPAVGGRLGAPSGHRRAGCEDQRLRGGRVRQRPLSCPPYSFSPCQLPSPGQAIPTRGNAPVVTLGLSRMCLPRHTSGRHTHVKFRFTGQGWRQGQAYRPLWSRRGSAQRRSGCRGRGGRGSSRCSSAPAQKGRRGRTNPENIRFSSWDANMIR